MRATDRAAIQISSLRPTQCGSRRGAVRYDAVGSCGAVEDVDSDVRLVCEVMRVVVAAHKGEEESE